ncbi:hypothetical protein BDK51DRAFT_32566 [Blyttiomyces helicus]|uniref:Uncharacterized protein n=1 Tax=Blyttiomyces helicus TaxID=388810 RepID=A0A4P9VV47_9FUNG|nr:hypothetical protein BDK51DRAFT_32566 [Blyttiomyces helicus]|eukprot:RKO83499.1 hypothetical protein BDK51DRAFT_32566 [Blyttiomyces helicus]
MPPPIRTNPRHHAGKADHPQQCCYQPAGCWLHALQQGQRGLSNQKKDACEHVKVMKQAELLVQKPKGDDECGGEDEHLAKNMACMSAPAKQTTTTHQRGPRMSTGMHRPHSPAPTPKSHFQITKKVSPPAGHLQAKNQTKQSGRK